MLLKFGFEFFCCVFLLGRYLWRGRENVVEPFFAFAMQIRHGYEIVECSDLGQIDLLFPAHPIEMELCQQLIVSVLCPKFLRT